MDIVSFDIFDTALIRKCGNPENVFWIMAKKLFPEDKGRQCKFVLWRKTLNEKTFRKNKNYTLEELYHNTNSETVYSGLISNERDLCKLEYAVESDILVANPFIVKKIRSYRKSGKKIVFISDMYMNSSFLRNLLVREGLFEEGDFIYVSCEHKARKDDGKLYEIVGNELNPTGWIHYGDNKHSDYSIPKKKYGIKAHLVDFGYSKIETRYNESSHGLENASDFSILMGYLRYLRLTGNNTPEENFAIDYIAPLYFAYVKHVITDATLRGIKTLYFLSRDSYIFMRIAEQMPHEGVELRYLFVSRKSIQPAFRYIATDQEYIDSINGNCTVVVRQESDKDSFILLDAYFVQEGVFDNNIALVDLGWFGSTRLMINKMRANRGVAQCFCYYLGAVRDSLPEVYGKYDAFTYSERFANNRWHTFIIEELFSLCPHPTIVGYKKSDNGLVNPVFGDESHAHKLYGETNIKNCCKFASENIPVDSSVLSFYGLNSFCTMDNELETEYIELLFDVCREEEFIFRRLSYKDLLPYVKGISITMNDQLALKASFGKLTGGLMDIIRRLYIHAKSFK